MDNMHFDSLKRRAVLCGGWSIGVIDSTIIHTKGHTLRGSGLSSGSGTATRRATVLGLTIRGSAPISLCSLKIQRSSAAWDGGSGNVDARAAHASSFVTTISANARWKHTAPPTMGRGAVPGVLKFTTTFLIGMVEHPTTAGLGR